MIRNQYNSTSYSPNPVSCKKRITQKEREINNVVYIVRIWAGARQNKMTCVSSKDSDQPGHLPSLNWMDVTHLKKPWVLGCLRAYIKYSNLTARWVHIIAPDKNLRSLGKYAPFFGELSINIFNWVSQYITVLFHCVFQNFQLGILISWFRSDRM